MVPAGRIERRMGSSHRHSGGQNQGLATGVDIRLRLPGMLAIAGTSAGERERDTMIKRKSKAGGFAMVELMFAIVVLTVAILGSTLLVVIGMQRNNANRVDTTATNAAQAVLEAISGTQADSDPTLTIKDCLGNNLSITTA